MKFSEDKYKFTSIAFDDEDIDTILAFQKQEGFNTVQEAIMSAVKSCLKD